MSGSPTSDPATSEPNGRPTGSSGRWGRVERIFSAALDETEPERRALLDRECGEDRELRREIESLLAGHDQSGAIDVLGGEFNAPARWRARVDAAEREGKRVGRYSVLEQLGAGGMGFVYKARDERLNRHVALKFLPPHLGSRADAKQRFLTEARAAARVDHANLCTIHEIGETDDGQLFIAMALYDGETLERRLERSPKLPVLEALSIAAQAAAGLAKAHEHGVVHRDVKPSNIMLSPDGGVKILDFGVARVDGGLLATHEHGALGTVAYMSPEQARGEPVDARTDVWSLGVVLYEMLAGERPFRAEAPHAIMQAVLTGEAKPLTQLRADAPGELDAILSEALAKARDGRYESMTRFAADLARILETERQHEFGEAQESGRAANAERRRSVVLWCVVSDYAAFAEQLAPRRLEQLMAEIRAAAVEVVRLHGGLVNQTLDEEIVALFGAPIAHEDDDLRASRAAMELVARIASINSKWRSELHTPVTLRCGLHSGVLVARRLSAGPQRYALAGRPAQVAARLAAFAPENTVVVSPECARLIAPFMAMQPLAPLTIGPDGGEITPHRLLAALPTQTRFEAAARKGLTPLVGRGVELAMMEAHLARASAGEGQLLLIAGEAGVGKSRLLYEMRERIGARARVLQARCRSQGAAPYLPFAELVREALHLEPGDCNDETAPEIVERIRTLDPALEQFAALYLHLLSVRSEAHALPRHLRGEPLREAMSSALAAVFIALARAAPTVLLFEDWHWADEGSDDALQRLLELAPANPILILVATRPEGGARAIETARAARIQLAPFDFDSSRAAMQGLFGVSRIADGLARRIHERSGGNPFFLEEVCHTLMEQKLVAVRDGEAAPAEGAEVLYIPDTVQAVIRTRLDALDKKSLEVLRVASVIGREFKPDILLDALGAGAYVNEAVDPLKAAGLIQQISGAPNVAYRFKHVLTQEVTYDSLLSHQRRALHDAVGCAIERHSSQDKDERAELLAHHFERAENWERAIRYGRIAAERASALSQFAVALAMLDRVQECIARLPEGEERDQILADVLFQQERLCETVGQRGRQQQIVADLIALLAPRGASAQLALAYLRQGDLLTLLKHFDAADRVLSTALRLSRERGDAALERHALRSLGLLRWHEGRHAEALAITRSALAIDRERGEDLSVAGDLANVGVIMKSMGEYEGALASFEEALAIPALIEEPSSLVYSLQNLANVHRELGNLDRALEHLRRADEISKAHHMPIQRSFHLMSIAHILLQQGRVDESLRTYRESIELSRRAHHADGLVQSLRVLGEVSFQLGRDAESLPCFEEAAALFAKLEDRGGRAEMLSRAASIQERSGDAMQAAQLWGDVRDLCADLGDARGELAALEGVARSVRKSGAPIGETIAHTSAALALAATLGDARRELALLNVLGILEWESARYQDALGRYEAALQLARRIGDQIGEGLILNSLGVTLARLGRGEEARTALEESIDLNRETGERMLEAHALAALGDVLRTRGSIEAARDCYTQSLAFRRALGDSEGVTRMTERLAALADTRIADSG